MLAARVNGMDFERQMCIMEILGYFHCYCWKMAGYPSVKGRM